MQEIIYRSYQIHNVDKQFFEIIQTPFHRFLL